ncbi:hypothetical protein BU14_0305s0003 [Porphyra umbilicalis]|uniref:Uncharacterized protein n=1 Tax=Porphyra umbilicalis TaxID=2786 RepID=A0A1X6NZW7_PORUM|nr:hypothetical protein BU14_0305s0003 [Porphyra umbilicalis]|eukprot:OSX74158.1 hypothetical protein BU14_0305s0003 [Porphyra umbilicalis]
MSTPSTRLDAESVEGLSRGCEGTAALAWTVLFMLLSSSRFLTSLSDTPYPAATAVAVIGLPIALASVPLLLLRPPQTARTLGAYAAYIAAPIGLQAARPGGLAGHAVDAVTVAALWAPLEARLLPAALSATGTVAVWGMCTGLLSAVTVFTVVRPTAVPIGYTYKLSAGDVGVGVAAAAAGVATVLPVAVAVGTAGRPHSFAASGVEAKGGLAVALYASALAEEILFRGLVQNLVADTLGPAYGRGVPLGLGAVVYAASHLRSRRRASGGGGPAARRRPPRRRRGGGTSARRRWRRWRGWCMGGCGL